MTPPGTDDRIIRAFQQAYHEQFKAELLSKLRELIEPELVAIAETIADRLSIHTVAGYSHRDMCTDVRTTVTVKKEA
jgi:hypothetical protein